MATTKRGVVKEKTKNPRQLKSDLTGKDTYQGELPSIVGRRRLLVRASGKESFIFVNQEAVPAIKTKYGSDFIRDCGVVTHDHKYLAAK